MRNLVAYPITAEETISILQEQKNLCNKDLVGDMTPVLLQAVIEFIRNHASQYENESEIKL